MRRIIQSLLFLLVVTYSTSVWALDAPVITAAAKGPNQINLTWSGVADPGYGYKIEIQSANDSRYSSWTELSWQSTTPQNTTMGNLTYLPYWVTEGHYLDVTDGSGTASGSCTAASTACGTVAQAQIYGLNYGTSYNFRVRTWSKVDTGTAVYSSYSNTATVTTTTPSTIRYVRVGGAGLRNGTSWANAWDNISDANGVAAGTLVLIEGGNYASDNIDPNNSGTQANRTVYQAYQGQTVNITSPTGGAVAVTLNTSYIVVDGINTTYTGNCAYYRYHLTGSRNAIVNFDASASGCPLWATVLIEGNYNLVHNYYVHDTGTNLTDNGSNMEVYGSYNYNIIQLGISIRGSHDNMSFINGATYNQLRNSRHGEWGHGITLVNYPGNTRYNLVEGNTMYGICANISPNWTGINFKNGIQIPSNNNTIRRNVIYGGASNTICKGQGIEGDYQNGGGSYNLVYNNTVYNNGGLSLVFWAGQNNSIVANNIFYNNGTAMASETFLVSLGGTFLWADNNTNIFRYNYIIQNSNPNYASIMPNVWSDGVARTLQNTQTQYSSIFYGNVSAISPDFIDITNNDVHLKSTSGAIDIGQQVTDTTWGTIGYRGTAPDLGAYEGDGGPPVPVLQFSSATYDVSEAGTTATITVTRTASSAGAVSVGYATSNGTATTAGNDYTATSGTLNWTDGDAASKTFTIAITNDTTVESSETVNITLSNPTNGAVLGSPSSVVLTITDNDSTGGGGSGSGGDSGGGSGGGGCGFVKDDGKGQETKGEKLSFAIMLIMTLAGIALVKRASRLIKA